MRIDVREKYGYNNGPLETVLEEYPENAWLHLRYDNPRIAWTPTAKDQPFTLNGPHLTLSGEGKGPEDQGLRYWRDASYDPASALDSTLVRIGPKANHVVLRDLVLSNNAPGHTSFGTGCGVLCESQLSRLTLDHVAILSPGRNCVRLAPPKGNHVLHATLLNVDLHGAPAEGFWGSGCNSLAMVACSSRTHRGWGMWLEDTDAAVLQLVIEDTVGGMYLKNCQGCQISCRFEAWHGWSRAMPALVLDNCVGCTVHSGVFSGSFKYGEPSIVLRGATTGCTILPSLHAGVGLSVDDGGTRGNVIYRQPTNLGGVVPWRVNANRNRVL